MVEECLGLLLGGRATAIGAVFVDATFGAGGHTEALLRRATSARVVALDADPAAVERARQLAGRYLGRLWAVHGNFAELGELLDGLGIEKVNGIVYDLGLSSLQLANTMRGFSFSGDEPLDMRLDPTAGGATAADLLNGLSERELAGLLTTYADEPAGRRIARQILKRRQRQPLLRTGDLVAAVLSAQHRSATRRRSRIHPATRTFLALRMAVNHELDNLERSLAAAQRRVSSGGRVVVISFHSGEDRIVKRTFKSWHEKGLAVVLTRSPLRPTRAEIAANPRSRSAKLRAVEGR